MISQVLQRLHELHSLEIVHGDLKPENLICDYPIVRLIDFGHAFHGTSHNKKGSFLYQAPEYTNEHPITFSSDM